jgi:hypothetical protein
VGEQSLLRWTDKERDGLRVDAEVISDLPKRSDRVLAYGGPAGSERRNFLLMIALMRLSLTARFFDVSFWAVVNANVKLEI